MRIVTNGWGHTTSVTVTTEWIGRTFQHCSRAMLTGTQRRQIVCLKALRPDTSAWGRIRGMSAYPWDLMWRAVRYMVRIKKWTHFAQTSLPVVDIPIGARKKCSRWGKTTKTLKIQPFSDESQAQTKIFEVLRRFRLVLSVYIASKNLDIW